MPFSLEDILPVLQQFPNADDKVIAAFAKAKKVLGDAWDWSNKPLLNLPDEQVQNPLGKFGLQMLEGASSPLSLVGLLSGVGSAGAAARGLYGLSKAGALVEGATNLPAFAQGVHAMATGRTPGEQGLGALMTGMGAFGLGNSARVVRNASRGMRAIPKTMELYAKPDYLGSSVHPVQGDAVERGLNAYMTGGAGLQQYKLPTGAPMTEEALAEFVNKNARAFKGQRHLGTWKDAEGRVNLDISDPVPDLTAAKRLGVERGEYELFNPATFEGPKLLDLPRAEREALMAGYSKPTRFLPETAANRSRADLLTPTESLLLDESGQLDLSGFNAQAKKLVDELAALKAGPYGNRFPDVNSLARRIRSGDIGPSPRNTARPQLVDPATSPLALDFNQRTPLRGIVEVGPRRGSRLTSFSKDRLDALAGYADQHLNPSEIEWTNTDWMKKFATLKEADDYARKFAVLSPQVSVRPDFRDAWSATLQQRMGIPMEQWHKPFGHESSGFGWGLADTETQTKRAGMRRALGTGPVSSELPGKVDELYELLKGNPKALPLDMHINRGLGNLADTPPTPVQYFLTKAAYNDFAGSRGFTGAAPHMAKSWSSVKQLVADHEPGFVNLVNRVHAQFPELFDPKFVPRNEQELFDSLMNINRIIDIDSPTANKFMASRATPRLF